MLPTPLAASGQVDGDLAGFVVWCGEGGLAHLWVKEDDPPLYARLGRWTESAGDYSFPRRPLFPRLQPDMDLNLPPEGFDEEEGEVWMHANQVTMAGTCTAQPSEPIMHEVQFNMKGYATATATDNAQPSGPILHEVELNMKAVATAQPSDASLHEVEKNIATAATAHPSGPSLDADGPSHRTYFKDHFFPFLQTTARIEGFNVVLKKYVNPHNSIFQFFLQYKKLQESIEVAEDEQEFEGEDKILRPWSDYPMEEQALAVYTRPIYL
ncbi:uncharacterized protein LOC112271698 [Brachypodium distachyon]|uniref:uncharacterized protein LOC112271698 n=1 Tax=Brachypodium distachyon TaxID=15368 RepID=UPI000D0D4D9C|nr:uncharacterized protein LOC112271698 [Brachypodium distachyon]|eukprot:XP_024317231.1 uncharacterized protein LOC112271698 [Brachypodium distachyon]